MKNLTAKNIQKFQTHDGYAWSASFYIDGKKIGTASDQGYGGEMNVDINADALAKIETYAATLPTFGGDRKIPQTANMVLESAMWEVVETRKTKSLLKRKVMAQLPALSNDIYGWKIAKGRTADEVMEKVLEQYPDAKLLNRMPLAKANRLLNPIAGEPEGDFELVT